MAAKQEKRMRPLDYCEGCPDCLPLEKCYTVIRVRRTIKRIAKAAMMPALGDEIINAIERPARKTKSS